MPVNDIRIVKRELRKKFREIRENMSPQKKSRYDELLKKGFLASREYKNNDIVFAFVSKPIEIDTISIIKAVLKDGKRVAVPRCVADKREMDFFFITSFDQLEKSTYGLMEPIPDKCEKVTDFSNGVCIVPGLAFDSEGFRLGFGMGYYDRFLSQFKGDKIGLCYSSCVKWKLPHGFFDRPVDLIITERFVRNIRKRKVNRRQ